MLSWWKTVGRGVAVSCLTLGILTSLVVPRFAPGLIGLGVASTAYPLWRAWKGAHKTALRPAVVWAMIAVGLAVVAQMVAAAESDSIHRPMAGHVTYVAVLATLASLVSVLNARTPGGGAWAILMALLVVVFLIPWLEAPGLARHAQGLERLHLTAPWTLFFALVGLAGVTNYLPTRYGPAALWIALGLIAEYLGLTEERLRTSDSGGILWSIFPCTLGLSLWTADWCATRSRGTSQSLESTWLWFRDHWGVVWALRIQERFNRTAEVQKWTIRLGWQGAIPSSESRSDLPMSVPAAAEPTLRSLLRRFAEPARIEALTGTCQANGESR